MKLHAGGGHSGKLAEPLNVRSPPFPGTCLTKALKVLIVGNYIHRQAYTFRIGLHFDDSTVHPSPFRHVIICSFTVLDVVNLVLERQ
jgi:hypothetical protein